MKITGETSIRIKTISGDRDIPAHLSSKHGLTPETTYKYLDIDSSFTRCSLENQYSYFSDPDKFNDPFDCVLPIDYNLLGEDDELFIKYFSVHVKRNHSSASSQQRRQMVIDLLNDSKAQVDKEKFFNDLTAKSRKLLKKTFSKYGVYSTSLINNNVLLWSHYANKHTGICLGIDPNKLIESLNCGGATMKYGPYPLIFPFNEYDKKERNEAYPIMFLSKAEFWNYESEYRFSILDCREDDRKQKFGSCIKSLILGSEISEENEKYAIKTCKGINPEIEIFKAKKVDFSFELDIIKF